jgi:hypothetical protein
MDLKYLWPYPRSIETGSDFPAPVAVSLAGPVDSPRSRDDLATIAGARIADGSPYVITSSLDPEAMKPAGYRLAVSPSGIDLVGADGAGLFYGAQTLLQILALNRGAANWPGLTVTDFPAYRKRALMVDMGRSAFSLAYLKRIVRILARLKMNQLHLHLFDDELCGIRFEGLPFGMQNPHAITIAELGELVRYAEQWHVEIMPELEGWAHVGSLTFHSPELRGGSGVYNKGSSFVIGPKAFDLMRELTRQVVDALPARGVVHFGLDEARWFPDPALPASYSPADLVRDYHDLLMDLAARAGKRMTMQVWADHGGRPIPQEIQPDCVTEPWAYWHRNKDYIRECLERYTANPRLNWVMGAGQAATYFHCGYYATSLWCRGGLTSSNCLGPDVCIWGWNDLDNRLMTVFAGAYFAWNPEAPTPWARTEEDEDYDKLVFPVMNWFQSHVSDADPDEIAADRGPIVLFGFYYRGKRHGVPVDPTARVAGDASWAWTPDHYGSRASRDLA